MNEFELIIALVSIITAAMFWIVTQWNIIRTKRVLLSFQKEARSNATDLINTQFSKMELMITDQIRRIKEDLTKEISQKLQNEISTIEIPTASELSLNMSSEIQKNLSSLSLEFKEIQSSTLESVNGQLNALVEVMKDQMLTTLDAKLKSWEAQKTRQLGKALEPYGVLIDESGNQIQAELAEQASEGLSPLQIAALEFINQRTSPQFAETNPGAAIFFKAAKLQAAKMFQDESAARGGKALNDSNKNISTTSSGIFG